MIIPGSQAASACSLIASRGLPAIRPSLQQRTKHLLASRQVVLFCIERRRAWRMLQSKAGITNPDYLAQRATLKRWDEEHPEGGLIDHAELRSSFEEALLELLPKKKVPAPVG